MKKYLANIRIIRGTNTGISRYVTNLLPYLKNVVIEKSPNSHYFYRGILGHFWDIISFIKYYKKNVWLTSHRGSPFLKNYVITIHDLQPILSRHSFSFYYYLYYKFFINLHIKKSKHIFTVSEKVKLDIINYYNVLPEKITVIYPGHEHLNLYIYEKDSKPFNFNYAIMYGNISEVKNSIFNINAWLYVNKYNSLKLLIIGNLDKSISTEFYEIINKNSQLIYLKYIDDSLLFNYLKNSSYLFFNSPNEGFGIPALEAVYFRIPVLYSSNSSVSEFISDYGVSVEQGDYQSLCDGLNSIQFLNTNNNKFEKIRSEILNNCSWVKSSKLMTEILKLLND
uniref:glycosyltransferase n=1 Tax=Polynucleobacter sp. TaxID=2029855 RepID=UPI0040489E0B